MDRIQLIVLPVLRRKDRLARLLFFACLLLSLPAAGRLFAQGDSQRLQIDYRDRLLSISARNADIKDFFARLAEKADIAIEYPASLEKRITMNRENISLKGFLASFLRNMNHAIVYSGSDAENSRISEVHIFPKSRAARSSTSTLSDTSRERIRRRIESYRRTVEKLRNSLSSVGENSSRGRVYSNRIQRYEERIRDLERQSY